MLICRSLFVDISWFKKVLLQGKLLISNILIARAGSRTARGKRVSCSEDQQPSLQRICVLRVYTHPRSYCTADLISVFNSFAARYGQYGSRNNSRAKKIKSARSFFKISSA